MKKNIIYVTYDGITDPLGQSQVLPYIIQLAKQGHSFDILSFEKATVLEKNRELIKSQIKDLPITWHPNIYLNKHPILSTLKNIRAAKNNLRIIASTKKIEIIHCRGYIASLVGLYGKKKFNLKFIFDMRGWWADEKLESGEWKGFIYKPVYRYFKKKEKQFFRNADAIISLTEKGKTEICKSFGISSEKISIIPTCVDLKTFKAFDIETKTTVRLENKIAENDFVLVYSGSIGGNYRFDLIIKTFRLFLNVEPSCKLIILANNSLIDYENEIKDIKHNIIILNTPYQNVHQYLIAADVGLLFYVNAFSAIGRCPTKLAEYWACGIPFISSETIGDVPQIAEKHPEGGYILKSFSREEITNCFNKIKNNQTENKKILRKLAEEKYDVSIGASIYEKIYLNI